MTQRTDTYDDEQWQLVPKKPTLAMQTAMQRAEWPGEVYGAILAAAPTPLVSAEAARDAAKLINENSELRLRLKQQLDPETVRDAARYRWLRDQDDSKGDIFVASGSTGTWGECGHCDIYCEALDEHIDAAIAAQQKEA